MTNEELIKQINSLPDDAKRRVEDFIARLRGRYYDTSGRPIKSEGSFKYEPFFGMWADREDMKDSVAWVRKIRREQWDLRRRNDPR